MSLTLPETKLPPGGDIGRFGRRWRLVGAGLSNVWHFGDLELPARSGRLLLRGPERHGQDDRARGIVALLARSQSAAPHRGQGEADQPPGFDAGRRHR